MRQSLAGLALDVSRHGLPWFLALACGCFVLFLLTGKDGPAAGPAQDDRSARAVFLPGLN